MSLCTTAHPLYTGTAKIFGASISETKMRPNPRRALRRGAGWRQRCSGAAAGGGGRPERPGGRPLAVGGGRARARSHRRFVRPLIHCIPDALRESVPLFLSRQRDWTLGCARHSALCGGASRPLRGPPPPSTPLCRIFKHFVGEYIRRCPMLLNRLECQVSKLVDSDVCPRPTTTLLRTALLSRERESTGK